MPSTIRDGVKFDDPVRELLPAGTAQKPTDAEITLLDLATQHSGLPRMPDNFVHAKMEHKIGLATYLVGEGW